MASVVEIAHRPHMVKESWPRYVELVTKLLRRCGGRQHIVPEPLAQRDLLDFAGSRMGDLVDNDHIVGHPPLGDLALKEPEQLLLGRGLILLEHNDEERPLVPLGM